MRIRKIHINNLTVFDPSHPEFDSWFFRASNHLHIKTRDRVIRNELLFKEGDSLIPDLLKESERNLRGFTFLTEVSIQSKQINNHEADIYVNTEDQWTARPALAFGKSKGERNYEVGVIEENFLGLGKTLGLKYEEDRERNTWSALYSDPRFLDTRLRLNWNFDSSSDGHRQTIYLVQPFYSQSADWSYSVRFDDLNRLDHLYYRGSDAAELDFLAHSAVITLSHSWGPRYHKIRAGLFASYAESLFPGDPVINDQEAAAHPEVEDNLDPIGRRVVSFGPQFERDRQSFVKYAYLDLFGRTEDLPVGPVSSFSCADSRNAKGPDYFTLAFAQRWAYSPAPSRYFISRFAISSRKEAGEWNNFIADTWIHYYQQIGAHHLLVDIPRQTVAINLASTFSSKMDSPFQLTLGENEGLRGYSFKTFTGLNKALLNLEDRFFTPWQNRLGGIGFVTFVDAGYVWGNTTGQNFGTAAGIGLRIGFKKYGRTRVFRLDVAHALTNTGRSRWSISTGAGQIFDIF